MFETEIGAGNRKGILVEMLIITNSGQYKRHARGARAALSAQASSSAARAQASSQASARA
jgi:hypothetical protein